MAGGASYVGMPIGERKSRGAVVKARCCPAYRRMARCAVRQGKSRSGRRMHRIIRLLPGGQMAS